MDKDLRVFFFFLIHLIVEVYSFLSILLIGEIIGGWGRPKATGICSTESEELKDKWEEGLLVMEV